MRGREKGIVVGGDNKRDGGRGGGMKTEGRRSGRRVGERRRGYEGTISSGRL